MVLSFGAGRKKTCYSLPSSCLSQLFQSSFLHGHGDAGCIELEAANSNAKVQAYVACHGAECSGVYACQK